MTSIPVIIQSIENPNNPPSYQLWTHTDCMQYLNGVYSVHEHDGELFCYLDDYVIGLNERTPVTLLQRLLWRAAVVACYIGSGHCG